jgi:P-type Cu2+ transporter
VGAMVGDGVNDAPVLAQANVSFALAHCAQIARSAADVVLLSARVGDVVAALQLSRRTVRVMRQNLAWAALYNAACVPLALLGYLPPWAAGLGMAASSAVVVMNAMRLARDIPAQAEPIPVRVEPIPVQAEVSKPPARLRYLSPNGWGHR